MDSGTCLRVKPQSVPCRRWGLKKAGGAAFGGLRALGESGAAGGRRAGTRALAQFSPCSMAAGLEERKNEPHLPVTIRSHAAFSDCSNRPHSLLPQRVPPRPAAAPRASASPPSVSDILLLHAPLTPSREPCRAHQAVELRAPPTTSTSPQPLPSGAGPGSVGLHRVQLRPPIRRQFDGTFPARLLSAVLRREPRGVRVSRDKRPAHSPPRPISCTVRFCLPAWATAAPAKPPTACGFHHHNPSPSGPSHHPSPSGRAKWKAIQTSTRS